MERAFAIRNKQGEILVFTVTGHKDDTISNLVNTKRQLWVELQAEGYEAVPVLITELPASDPAKSH